MPDIYYIIVLTHLHTREAEAKARAEYEELLQRETEERARLAEEVKARRAAEERLEQERREQEQEIQRKRQVNVLITATQFTAHLCLRRVITLLLPYHTPKILSLNSCLNFSVILTTDMF